MSATTLTRFTGLERALHLVFLVFFLILAATGAFLFFGFLQGGTVGEAGLLNRLIHRIAGAGLILTAVVYVIFGRAQARETLRWLRLSREDWKWFRPGLRAYWTGETNGVPPQGKFNTGQKLHAWLQIVCFLVFAVTGLVLWFWVQGAPTGLYRASVLLHSTAFVFSVGGFMIHFYLAAMHPKTRSHINAMVDGRIPEAEARTLYPRWHAEMAERAGGGNCGQAARSRVPEAAGSIPAPGPPSEVGGSGRPSPAPGAGPLGPDRPDRLQRRE